MAEDMTEERADCLIWSPEHGAWWGPKNCGYFDDIVRAGLYTRSMAERICRGCTGRGERVVHVSERADEIRARHEATSRMMAALGEPTDIERLRAAAARWRHVTEQAYLATNDDGALLLTVYIADDTDVPFLTARERAQLAGDAPPYGMVSGVEAITRVVDADRAAVAQSQPAAIEGGPSAN